MRVFITGATGFIGSRLTEQLVDAGHDIVALARSPDRARDLEAMGVELVQGDITDKASMRDAMEGAEALFHLAAWYDVGTGMADKRARRVNVDGTRNVLELMDELDVQQGVYTSTLAINSDTNGEMVDENYRFDGEHLSLYDETKWAAHHEVAAAMIEQGLPLTIVQPGVVYGPGDPSPMGRLFRAYLTGQLPMVPRQTAYCWAHVEDTARGHLLALEKGEAGQSYIIAGQPRELVDVMALAEKITGIPAPRSAPAWVLGSMSWLMRPIAAVTDVPSQYHPETLRVSAGATYLGDNSKARDALGFDPRGLDEGLEQTLIAEMETLGVERR